MNNNNNNDNNNNNNYGFPLFLLFSFYTFSVAIVRVGCLVHHRPSMFHVSLGFYTPKKIFDYFYPSGFLYKKIFNYFYPEGFPGSPPYILVVACYRKDGNTLNKCKDLSLF
ncbi:hypothetical protein DFA_11892 [Cavenderia fasciculata]|uniref:Uncharacterized protein n=1 Tax=Cavenderia fasciculata TaxID=261658 RepID=F4QEL7_CACFS|nr:uncharacterized protein DFA_11892 [Cavenderia fasciculata]EGG14128.1 hypothetical protein DFA_11892 [Cavenderia fasciculata]|eukprot:XP_004350836.1 hypothetical protein DFA_11892 [Cavenderia fasciculata]